LLWAAENEGVDLRQSSYIPNAVDPPKPAGQLPSWTDLGLPQLEGKRVIGSLGRLDRQKGYDILINALSRIPPGQRSDLSVVVFGEGTDRCCLETLRDRCGLEDVLFLPGVHTNVEYILPKLWSYVQPSRFEGTPNAVMEALAAGLPVHASAVDGLIELPKSQNLRFVEQTPEAWASALQDIASKKLTRDHVVTCFLGPRQTSERYLDTLWKVLKSVEKWACGSDPRELYELAHAKSKLRPYSR
jgi:glycosyltransferase involved in cell wall biosynthesis